MRWWSAASRPPSRYSRTWWSNLTSWKAATTSTGWKSGSEGAADEARLDRFSIDDLIDCYRRGVFPMADARHDRRVFLVDPARRGVIPLDGFHVSRRLARTVRSDRFEVRIDSAFSA